MFAVGRKSTKILERKNNADAVSSMQSTYDVFLTHYKEQYDELKKANAVLSETINKLNNRLSDIEIRNAILSESSQEWEKKFRELEKNHDILKLEFDNYKKKHENK